MHNPSNHQSHAVLPPSAERRQQALRGLFIAGVAVLCAGSSCNIKHNDAILFATSTQFGVKVGVNAQQIPELQVGYNRQEGALVPLYKADGTAGIVNTNQPDINGLLSEASKLITEAQRDSAAWTTTGKGRLTQAALLVEDAVTVAATTKQAPSPTLKLVATKVKALKDSPDFKANELVALQANIAAELGRSTRVKEFNEALKYVASHQPQEKRDAYSVLGTFSGGGGSSSSGNTSEAKLSQFFATGVAAQLLAESGGAALVSTKAKTPAEVQAETNAKKIQSVAPYDVQKAVDVLRRGYGAFQGDPAKKSIFDNSISVLPQGRFADFKAFVGGGTPPATADEVKKVRAKLDEDAAIKAKLAELDNQ